MNKNFSPHIIKLFSKPELFDASWYRGTYPDVELSGMSPHDHYKRFGTLLGRAPNSNIKQQLETLPWDAVVALTEAAVSQAPTQTMPWEFDEAFYLQTNPYIDHRKLTPFAHFSKFGHKDFRNPNADFDIIWYLQKYGHTFDVAKINPFAHYLQEGKSKGFEPHPPRHVIFDKKYSRPLPANARRACLFAAYDADSYIDEYVLVYLREMSKHADIFYMADCDIPKSELAKLDGIVKEAWAWRHGAYDFGSYSILARDLVGWDTLAKYDEVVFANDSCYLVKPLDETFALMDGRSCAWWGLHATKGTAATRPFQPFPATGDVLNIDEIKLNLLDQFEYDPIYDFHIGSYFIVFRNDIIIDKRFQRVINSIHAERRKMNTIFKYEVGLTHFLIGHGYEFSTWAETVKKNHPVYTDVVFDLIKEGFPLLKRFMLAENPYKISSLAYWKTALTQANSLTSILQIEDNYLRVSNARKLYQNFNIVEDNVLSQPPMGNAEFQSYDDETPKYDHYWGFPVCPYDHTLSDNGRSVFECVKDDPKITKVIFTRDRTVRPGGVNVICVPLESLEGQAHLARCRNLFVRHSAQASLEWPISAVSHNIIRLSHYSPLMRIESASLNIKEQRKTHEVENNKLHAIISASEVNRLEIASTYSHETYEKIWLTGLPRHDFITKPEAELPSFLRAQLEDIRQLVAGRGIILFCSTSHNDQKHDYYSFTPKQVTLLAKWLRKHNMILAILEHPAVKDMQYSSQLSGDTFVRVAAGRFPDVEMLYREAEMLITNYSSCFIDYMQTGRPMISFSHDLQAYKKRERGPLFELNDVFPGLIAQDFRDLINALDSSVKKIRSTPSKAYQAQRKFFMKYTDAGNADRVIEHTKAICKESSLVEGFRAAAGSKTPKSITFLYAVSGNASNRHRIFALLSHLRAMGWTCHAMDINHTAIEVLAKAQFVSFCRLEMSTLTLDLAEAVRDTGGKVIYDTDDIIHDETIFLQSEYFARDPKSANKLQLLSKKFVNLMRLADGFTVTTPALLRSVKPFGRPAVIVNNNLSEVLIEQYADVPIRDTRSTINLCYFAGTAVDSIDFDECKVALLNLLLDRPGVVLHIVGSLDVNDLADAAIDGQVQRHGLMSYAAMHVFLRNMDINLAPLADTPFNDALSALKVFEAALHSIPTIASPSEPYGNAIQDRATGYLARTQQDWSNALYDAVDNPDMRHKIGDAARHIIVCAFSAKNSAKQLSDFLDEMATK